MILPRLNIHSLILNLTAFISTRTDILICRQIGDRSIGRGPGRGRRGEEGGERGRRVRKREERKERWGRGWMRKKRDEEENGWADEGQWLTRHNLSRPNLTWRVEEDDGLKAGVGFFDGEAESVDSFDHSLFDYHFDRWLLSMLPPLLLLLLSTSESWNWLRNC